MTTGAMQHRWNPISPTVEPGREAQRESNDGCAHLGVSYRYRRTLAQPWYGMKPYAACVVRSRTWT